LKKRFKVVQLDKDEEIVAEMNWPFGDVLDLGSKDVLLIVVPLGMSPEDIEGYCSKVSVFLKGTDLEGMKIFPVRSATSMVRLEEIT